MDFTRRHKWEMEPSEAVALQKEMAGEIRLQNELPKALDRVAGVDVSYEKHGDLFYAGVVVLSFPDLAVVEEASCRQRQKFPYIPGLLSFRELPVVLEAFRSLKSDPDVVLVDGQGIAHPRRLGLAAHLGLWLDRPTIGCAKSRLCGVHDNPGPERGARVPLRDGEETIGQVVRTRDGVKPMYISPGHKVDIETAAEIALACGGGYRLPEPTRQAHLYTNRLRLADRPGCRS
ncbi:MAG: deoxyribonuclease V [Desulfuromonadales bacterium]|nr:deoxyribonuclease V [Desulfuromonadales bacterium]NIR33367.1 deoxyribonuclease V [Desulfuromonadales bacterium]NIS39566.1 deoxyribonuclease V [Desulfuromonadales bacterium]